MSKPITKFDGEYRFLSNFFLVAIDIDDHSYPSVEHAYQAAKTHNANERARIRRARSAGAAKHLGRRVTLRSDWDSVKLEVMRRLVRQKFHSDRGLRRALLATRDAELIEGNHWRDTFWGQCPIGHGFNHLGEILMEVRAELKERLP